MQDSPIPELKEMFSGVTAATAGDCLLLRECESWAGQQGCAEFASDCELFSHSSLGFHLRSGFTEANRIICFTKRL